MICFTFLMFLNLLATAHLRNEATQPVIATLNKHEIQELVTPARTGAPTPKPAPTASPTPSPTTTPSPTASPTASPTPSPTAICLSWEPDYYGVICKGANSNWPRNGPTYPGSWAGCKADCEADSECRLAYFQGGSNDNKACFQHKETTCGNTEGRSGATRATLTRFVCKTCSLFQANACCQVGSVNMDQALVQTSGSISDCSTICSRYAFCRGFEINSGGRCWLKVDDGRANDVTEGQSTWEGGTATGEIDSYDASSSGCPDYDCYACTSPR